MILPYCRILRRLQWCLVFEHRIVDNTPATLGDISLSLSLARSSGVTFGLAHLRAQASPNCGYYMLCCLMCVHTCARPRHKLILHAHDLALKSSVISVIESIHTPTCTHPTPQPLPRDTMPNVMSILTNPWSATRRALCHVSMPAPVKSDASASFNGLLPQQSQTP